MVGRIPWPGLVICVGFVLKYQPVVGKRRPPLDISGTYDQVFERQCRCWEVDSDAECDCVHQGCSFVERFTLGAPDEDGDFAATIHATDDACLNTTFGPFLLNVDASGGLLGGVHYEGKSPEFQDHINKFNFLKLEQDMKIVMIGNVYGFRGARPSLRAVVIERENVTVCDTRQFLEGRCEMGHPRYTCRDVFAWCSGGSCRHENKERISPKEDDFFSRFSGSALNGTYWLAPQESSEDCPNELSLYQFGSQVGVGLVSTDMHLARVVDTSMAWQSGSVQFQTQCSGIQWSMDMAVAGEIHLRNQQMEMTIFLMLPWHEEGRIEVHKCVMRRPVAPRLFDEDTEHVALPVRALLLVCLGFLAIAAYSLHSRSSSDAPADAKGAGTQ